MAKRSIFRKLPTEIIDIKLNNATIDNTNLKLESYKTIEENGQKFIKLVTKNTTPQTYIITLDVDLSPDPRIASTTKTIELYATNENGSDYYYKGKDIHDVNNNLNTEEQVNHTTTSISMVSPNSLLTNQTATNYDEKGSMVISPQVADIKPIYAIVDQEQVEEQKAKIGVQIKNNYASTISEIQLIGKIPFEGNTYVISGGNLGSSFTTKMTKEGIEIPEELKEIATVYYSENENPDRDINKEENNWKTAEQIENWDNIKTFLIDLGNYVMPTGKELVFNYSVKIPNGLEFNKVAYSHHGVYFCLDTEQGKYKTQTEPNRLGFRIAEKYDIELEKYQTGKDKKVSGATYSIKEIIIEEGTEKEGETKTGVTNAQGIVKITNLYANKIYEIKEIKTPDDYELNQESIRFIGHVDGEGKLSIEKIEGTTREEIKVIKNEGENYKVEIKVEDEAKATLKITKKEKGTENKLQNVRYKLTGYGLAETGKTITNTFEVPSEKVTIPVTKTWNDNNNEAEKRPTAVTIQVKTGSRVVAEEILTEETNWKHEFQVAKYDEKGDKITYTVEEKEVVASYELNTKTEENHTFTDLPKYNDLGNEIQYKVDEKEKTAEDLHFYQKEISEVRNVEGESNKKEATITNTFEKPNDTTEITINKIWKDNEIQAKRRLKSIIVEVKEGKNTVAEREVTKSNEVEGKENQWTITIEGLEKYDKDGQEIEYTVDEKEKNKEDLKFYEKEITKVIDNQATIRNTFKKPEHTTEITVTKKWEDNNNENQKRPESIKLQLKNGETIVKEQILNKTNEKINKETNTVNENVWEYTFKDIGKYNENGEEIQYTVEEQEEKENDLKFYEKVEKGLEVTNTFKVPDERINVTVIKVWEDNETQSQRRPESIILVLKQEETEIARKEINTSNEVTGNTSKWSYTFTNLPRYNTQGNEIQYTVDEEEKKEGDLHFYTKQIGKTTNEIVEGKENGNKNVVITNTFTRPTDSISIQVSKIGKSKKTYTVKDQTQSYYK